MHTFLQHDTDSGELRLVMTDLWNGQHERTEFRVIDSEGRPVRKGQDYNGLTAYRDSFGGHYVKVGPMRREVRLTTEQRAIGETAKTPCPKAENKRRKCALCA